MFKIKPFILILILIAGGFYGYRYFTKPDPMAAWDNVNNSHVKQEDIKPADQQFSEWDKLDPKKYHIKNAK